MLVIVNDENKVKDTDPAQQAFGEALHTEAAEVAMERGEGGGGILFALSNDAYLDAKCWLLAGWLEGWQAG